MRKILKIILALVLLFIAGMTIFYFSVSMSLPAGKTGKEAEVLADKMLDAIGYEEYKQLEKISWIFRGVNHHEWDKTERTVKSSFDGNEVFLNFKTGEHKVLKTAGTVTNDELITQAIGHFYNDSFWLVAPFKIRDKGVTRKLVETDDGPGLLVTYTSGGVTPGDSYLWVLGDDFRPKYWRIWTSNVPIPGMKFEWSDWAEYEGALFSVTHPSFGPLSIDITNLEVQ